MFLFLKCHKVSLEVILEIKRKRGCFAWSWKVSVPKKKCQGKSGETRGRWKERKLQPNCFGASSANSTKASTVHGYQKKLYCGLLAEYIFVCVYASRKSFTAIAKAALLSKPGGASRAARSSQASLFCKFIR